MINKHLAVLAFVIVASSFTAYADTTTGTSAETTDEEYITKNIERDFNDTGDSEDAATVHFLIHTPANFTQEVDIYLDAIPTVVTYNPKETENGYVFTKDVPAGTYHVTVGIPNNNGMFNIVAPDTFNTDETNLMINISAVDETDDSGDYEDDWDGDDAENPLQLDYTNGSSSAAVVTTRMYPCYAVKSAELTLEDQNGRKYNVPFNTENGFAVQLKLPAGSYHELNDINVQLDDISNANGATFEWAYDEDHKAAFGTAVYTIAANENAEFGPYVIMMNLNGKRRVIDSTFLNENSIQKNVFDDAEKSKDTLQNDAALYDNNTVSSDDSHVNYNNVDGVKISDGNGSNVISPTIADDNSKSSDYVENTDITNDDEQESINESSPVYSEESEMPSEDEQSDIDIPMVIMTIIGAVAIIFGIIVTLKRKKK